MTALKQPILSAPAANEQISKLLLDDASCFIGRMGSIETTVARHYLKRAGAIAPFLVPEWPEKRLIDAPRNAGIAVPDDHALDRFASIYLSAIPQADMVGRWAVKGMDKLFDMLGNPGLLRTELANLGPWPAYEQGYEPWTQALRGRTVLLVHPFGESIRSQYEKRQQISTVRDLLPTFELKTLHPPVTFAGEPSPGLWEENFADLTARLAQESFDVAIIGCGAYGFPLGSFVKMLGRKAVHLGGATQLLFGIKGKRWSDLADFAHLIGEGWVSPADEEKPKGAGKIEDGCYW